MRYGFGIPNFRQFAAPDPLRELARAVDDLGYDSLWVSDHVVVPTGAQFLPDELTEILTTMSFLAAVTERVTLGSSVLVVPYRPAVLTAKILSTIDVLAKGRLVVGVGVGRLVEEFDALGAPYAERWARTEEDLAVWHDLWSTEDSSFDGRWSSYRDIRMFPKGHGGRAGPPIYFGGGGPMAIDRAARLAAGWHPIQVGADAPMPDIAAYRKACADAGRDGVLSLRYMAGYPMADPDNWPFAGSPDERAAAVRTFRDAGVDELVIDGTMLAMSQLDARQLATLLDRFMSEVVPNV